MIRLILAIAFAAGVGFLLGIFATVFSVLMHAHKTEKHIDYCVRTDDEGIPETVALWGVPRDANGQ